MTQYIAQSLCRAQGGPLAQVSADEELAAVQYFIQSQDLWSTNGVWLDGSDGKEEGTWLSSSGKQMSYLGWAATEPNGGTVENCIRLYGVNVH